MSETDTIRVGAPMPRIQKVVACDGFRIGVTWERGVRKGTTTVVDLAPLIGARKILAPLRDRGALFESVHVVEDGAAIAWGDDDQIELAATTVESYANDCTTPVDLPGSLESA
jgi:hypothetical protein